MEITVLLLTLCVNSVPFLSVFKYNDVRQGHTQTAFGYYAFSIRESDSLKLKLIILVLNIF